MEPIEPEATADRKKGIPPARRAAEVRAGEARKSSNAKRTVKLSVEIDIKLDDQLRIHTALSRRTKSSVIVEALGAYLGRHGKGRKYLRSADQLAADLADECDGLAEDAA